MQSLNWKEPKFCDLSVRGGISKDLRKASIVSLLKRVKENESLYTSMRLIHIFGKNPEKDSESRLPVLGLE